VSGISIPEALRKNLRPRRAIAGSARPRSPSHVERGLAKAYTTTTQRYEKRSYAMRFEAGLASTESTLAAARPEAHALLCKLDAAGLAAASLEALVVAERMVWEVDHQASLAPSIAAARGLADAVEAVARATRFKIGTLNSYTTSLVIVPAKENDRLLREPCLPLRHLVCAAPEKQYAAARDRAERLRSEGDLLRSYLAYAFPDEAWANVDLEAALAPGVELADFDFLLSAASEIALVRRWVAAAGPFAVSTHALDLACSLSPSEAIALFSEALPKLLVKPKYGPLLKTPPRAIAQALACIGTKEAAAVLAPYANHTILAPVVLAFFGDHPELGGALEAQAKGKGKLEATAARVLGKRESKSSVPMAKRSDIPPVLRNTPWRARKAARSEVVIKGLSLLGLDRERFLLVREPPAFVRDTPIRDMTAKELAAWKAEAEEDEAWVDYDLHIERGRAELLRVPDAEGLRVWNEKGGVLAGPELAWVKKHGLAAIPGFLLSEWGLYDDGDDSLDALKCLVSPRTAPLFARVASRKAKRRVANAWLVEHAEVAAFGLIPDALSSRKEARHHAETALLMLARHGEDALVRKVAKKYGKEAARGIDALLDRDPLAIDATVPKRPDFLRIGELPPVKTRSTKALSAGRARVRALDGDALSALVEMLQISAVDDPYPGIALVREACDEASLGAFAIELMEQWVIGDAPGRHEWMLLAVVHFPSERGTRRVAELAREWARKNMAKAERACGALAADGSDLALMHLAHIAETTHFAALKKSARHLLRDAAAARGLTEAELGDRTVPDAGLGPDGTITLSYGARELVVSCDASLRPVVREKTKAGLGPSAKTLPRPGKTDDLAKAKQARERFDQLKKDLEGIGKHQVRRLEQALVEGRTWSVADFEARIVAHPLLRHLAAALVWERVTAKGEARAFRIAEDGTFADVRDRRIELPAKGSVRLAHPVRTPDLVEGWSTVFADYEIVQPFEQLGRARHAPTPAEKKTRRLASAGAITVPARTLLGTMEARGWRRNDAGFVSAWLRPVRSRSGDELTARWPIAPEIAIESLANAADVVTGPLVVEASDGQPVALGELDEVAFSEIVRDISVLRDR
jgi:Domain of unknown function (DUF4132)